jgi:hypothetical protein
VPWLLVALAGMIFQQSAFRAGALTASLPTMTVAKPVVAGALGVLLLGEAFAVEGPEVFVLIGAVALVIVATVGLARGEAASIAAETGRDVKLHVGHEGPNDALDDVAAQVSPHRAAVSPAGSERCRTIT